MTTKLEQAINAIKSGNKTAGRQLLSEILKSDSRNETAWLWMSKVVDSEEKRKQYLTNVLAINPNNDEARRALAGGRRCSHQSLFLRS